MTRYSAMFAGLAQRGEGAFGAFVMLGDADLDSSASLLEAVAEGGADMIEVGIPFSDPIADGPVIQAAAERALRSGVRPDDCFELLRNFRARNATIPLGILTYANLVVARGIDRLCRDSAEAGVDSLLIADVPSLEAEPFAASVRGAGLDFIMIAAPNTSGPALSRIARLASGYTYCVARPGVTGVRERLALDHRSLFSQLDGLGAPPPVLGFGISTPDHVRQALHAGAAGVITGSALLTLAQSEGREAARNFIAAMKQATR
ncbi:MAG TPA: tryptophan synthase subunit alpha [Sphingomicrobium sp.]|nr:tryptophan synthase subunit alpha [Sphingomicrobium sp.]